MSLDNFTECKTCHQNLSVSVWVKLYGSLAHADLDGAPDFLSVMIPDAAVLKVVMCYGCQTFKPSCEYTPEEEAALAKRTEKQQEKLALGKKFEGLLGGMIKPSDKTL